MSSNDIDASPNFFVPATFELQAEEISGRIPEEMKNWTRLDALTICETDIKGRIPDEWCERKKNDKLWITKLDCACCDKDCSFE